jgi:hypothetical protein
MINPVIRIEMSLEWIQSMAEANYGRELNDTELKRLGYALYDEGNLSFALDEAVINSIEFILNKSENWKKYDLSCKEDNIESILQLKEETIE